MKINKIIKGYFVIPVLIIAAIAVYYFYGWNIGAALNKDKTAYDMAELTNMICEQIDVGSKSGIFYLSKDITEENLKVINDYICSINGYVDYYTILINGRNGNKVLFAYTISDNYYVYKKYVDGEEIPADHASAVKLYEKVEAIIDECITDDMSDYEKELALHDYIVKNCVYGYTDYSKKLAYRAYGALVQNRAVCNGYAEAMSLLLGCVGIENDIVSGYAGGELHAWNRALIDDKWYQVDVTWDDPVPDRGSYVGHMYFNVTDDIMDDTHSWDRSNDMPCDSMDYNYYKRNNLICNYEEFKNVVKSEAQRDITATIEVVLTDYSEEKYNYDFMWDIEGLMYYQKSQVVDEYGEYKFITLYLNQRD